MAENKAVNDSASLDDVKEFVALINKLNEKQKEIVLATLRGAVLIADSEKIGA